MSNISVFFTYTESRYKDTKFNRLYKGVFVHVISALIIVPCKNLCSFLLNLKTNVNGKEFSRVKTKTKSNLAVKLAGKVNRLFLLSI